MTRLTSFLFVISILFASMTANVSEAIETNPSRARVLVHSSKKLSTETKLNILFIPSGNLMQGIAPMGYLSVANQLTGWLNIAGYVGWVFKANKPNVSLSAGMQRGNLWSWTFVDGQLMSWNGYYFTQVDYKILKWLHAGVEAEGWGNIKDESSWSHGVGVNVLLRFGTVGVDVALHDRPNNGADTFELFMRVHLFL